MIKSKSNTGILRLLAAALWSALVFTIPLSAYSYSDSAASTDGFNIGAVSDQFAGPRKSGNLIDTIINIINALLLIAAIAAVVYIILAGVRYFSSQGDEDSVEQAKNSLIYGVIGIIVILLAIVIIRFFTSQVV